MPASSTLRLMCLLAACTLAACANLRGSNPLERTSWQLVRVSGSSQGDFAPLERERYTLSFEPDGSLLVRADCNRGQGRWNQPADARLQLGPVALTRMMCPAGSQGDRFALDLDKVNRYALSPGRLQLRLSTGALYEFEPLQAAAKK
ncbi:MAG: META domain-containing protein [Rhodocyclaceae bacterium]|jgi:heat shock protein HslJ